MARPRMPIGTWGKLSTPHQLPSGEWETRARFRNMDGSIKFVRRTGKSKTAATNNLKSALSDLAGAVAAGGAITVNTPVPRLISAWMEEIEDQGQADKLSANTLQTYRLYINKHILPAFRDLQTHELTVALIDGFMKTKRTAGYSYATTNSFRAILSGVCGYAVRHKALHQDPVRDIARLTGGTQKSVRALSKAERSELLDGLDACESARDLDLPDLVRIMLATGVRLGEVLALTGEEISTDAATVLIDWHVVRINGEGVTRVPHRKGGRRDLVLSVPEWSVPMFRRRKLAAGQYPLFPSLRDGWRDPGYVAKQLRTELDAAGFDWVTSHVFRKTVGTVLDEAGKSASEVADQLGNTPAVAERHYRAPRVANTELAAALETMVPNEGRKRADDLER